MDKIENQKQFALMMKDIHKDIVSGNLDQSIVKLQQALNFYEEKNMTCDFINIFEKGSNVIEAATKRALFLDQLNRIIIIAKKNKLSNTLGIYYRYFALAQTLYGAPDRGLEIVLEAETLIDVDTGLYIELRNAKALILSKLKLYKEALNTFLFNNREINRLNYLPGQRFLHNIGSAYKDVEDYESAIPYYLSGIEYDLKSDYILNAVDAMIELSGIYLKTEAYDEAFEILEKANGYEALSSNNFLFKSYCEVMYILLKQKGDYQEALDHHEMLMALEMQLNMDRYSGMIAEFNMKYDLSEKEKEYAIIKSKNFDLEMMGKKLENMNGFLKKTLDKSRAMQEDLKKKNIKLEKTMASLNETQEKLFLTEKRSALDHMFINIAHHMSIPLEVMNSSIKNIMNLMKDINLKYDKGDLSKKDLLACINDHEKSLDLLDESLKRVVSFLNTLRLYKSGDEEKPVKLNLKTYFLDLIKTYKTTKEVKEVQLKCPDEICLTLNVSLLDKCIDLISNKLIAASCQNSFDVEVSQEINMVSIGLGDFHNCETQEKVKTTSPLIDTYDFYIIQTIVENLMNGRFIKFTDGGKDYFQFVFHTNS